MRFVSKCRFLKIDLAKTKDGKEYGVVALLDYENNSCKFFVFDDLKDKFFNEDLKELQFIECAFETLMYSDKWQVRLMDFKKVESNGNK